MMHYLLRASLPHWIVALLIPIASFYAFALTMFIDGNPTTGASAISMPKDLIFWEFYNLPASALIGLLGFFIPSKRRTIDWGALIFLFLFIYMTSPRLNS